MVNEREKQLRRSLYAQSFLEKSSAVISSRVTEALDMVSSSSQSPFAGEKKEIRPCKASGSTGAKKPTEVPTSDNDNIDGGTVLAEVL